MSLTIFLFLTVAGNFFLIKLPGCSGHDLGVLKREVVPVKVDIGDGQPKVHQVDHVVGLAAGQPQQKVLWLYIPSLTEIGVKYCGTAYGRGDGTVIARISDIAQISVTFGFFYVL
jgi:hypothetical protein